MRRVYLETIRSRYRKSTRKEKSKILDEFCAVCGYERKYAIRILWGHVEPRSRRPGPKRVYSHNVMPHLIYFWNAMNRCCSKKMKAALPLWLPFYREPIDAETKRLLLQMSSATIDRRLRDLSATRSSWVKSKIPIKLLDAEIKEPGYLESDTVAHCGNSLSGEFINTLTVTDLYSGWTEDRAMLTKTAEQVVSQVKKIEEKLPFEIKGLASDNGSEFLNEELHSYLKKRRTPVEFVRRRPYKKNDNAHVEQKNFTHVRSLFGYTRYEDPELVTMMNEIYQAYWNPLWNYFTPCMKLKSKTRIGARVKKEYDIPKTPAQRLIEHPECPLWQASYLKDQLRGRNPFWLKQQLDKKLKDFFDLVEKKKAISKVAS
jgi:integrase-like protein